MEAVKTEKDFFEGDVVVRCGTLEQVHRLYDVCERVLGREPMLRNVKFDGMPIYGVVMVSRGDGSWSLGILAYGNNIGLPEMYYEQFLEKYETDQAPTNHRPSTDQVKHEGQHEVSLTPHHYASPIQAIDYIEANGLDFCEGNVVKYVTRWRKKGGVSDLEKAKYYVERLIKQAKDGDSD